MSEVVEVVEVLEVVEDFFVILRGMMVRTLRCSAVVIGLFFFLTAQAAPVPFADMEKSWFRYRESVAYLQARGGIGGYPDGTFKPKATINRAEFLKLVFRSKGAPEPVSGDCFRDVKADAWYAPFVCAAQRRGIIQGYPSGTGSVFKPEQPVAFSEAIKMTLAAYGKDIKHIPGEQWYEPYAAELDREHILPRHSYIPWKPLTRERAADLIANFLRHEEERVIGNLSAGCGKAAPQYAPSDVRVGGRDRQFLLTVPQGYVPHDPSPLIVAFHGRTNSNQQVRSYMRLDRTASEFFIAYPAALDNGNGTRSWSDPGDKPSELRDLAFFDALVERLAGQYCIDLDRIFVVGHSLGAWMANSVACVRGDVVRASGTVAGDSVITPCAGPSAAIFINNPDDALSPIRSAERARDMRLTENACEARSQSADPQTLLCRRYLGCDGGNDVVWCPHELDNDPQGKLYPHNWPRESAPAIVDFFRDLR